MSVTEPINQGLVSGEVQGEKKTGLDLLREPFPPHQISKLPKPTKAQTEAVKNDYKKGMRCKICGGWHHPDVVHLDYVGHAALTARLLDCDPAWSWEPVSFDGNGSPFIDNGGGLWIKLTVCGVTRYGYGHPDGKKGGDAVKEAIGDALRNAAMRFGAALDLWHKGDLHLPDGEEAPPQEAQKAEPKKSTPIAKPISQRVNAALDKINKAKTVEEVAKIRELSQGLIKDAEGTESQSMLIDALDAKEQILMDMANEVEDIMNGNQG